MSPGQRTMKILFVDEQNSSRKNIMEIFKNRFYMGGQEPSQINYQMSYCQSGTEAFKLFKTNHPDLVLISLGEKSADGHSLCRKIREHEEQRHTGIIFYLRTERLINPISAVECLELGADDFVTDDISSRELIARVNAVLRLKAMTDELRSANHRLEILSLTDDLTGMHNMRSFNAEYQNMLTACKEGRHGIGIVLWDLDHFKEINDRSNHLVGSFIISEIGKLIRFSQVLGPNACLARYGGDEYISCLPIHDPTILMKRADNLRKMIEGSSFKKETYKIKITASVGACWVEPFVFNGQSDDPIKAADVMLYRSKAEGRNRVNGMILRYPVDLNHVGRTHLIDWDACGNDDNISRSDNF